MKKTFLLVVALVTTLSMNAQYREGTWTLQPKTGVIASGLSNMPDLDVDKDLDLEKSVFPGVLFGAEFEYQITDMVSVAAALQYTLQGGLWKDYREPTLFIKDTKIELGYVNLPIVGNVYLFKGFAVKAGVQLSVLTNAKLKSLVESGGVIVPLDLDDYDDFHKVDFSIPVGVSYELNNHVVFDLRYIHGLTTINKVDDQFEKSMKNRALVLSVGYKLNL